MIPLFKVAMHPSAPEAVRAVLESGYVGQGPKVEEFESKLFDFFGHKVLTTNSCTSALDLALHLCDVGHGDEVISTPLTCTATNGVIARRGAKIRWSDIDRDGLIDPVWVSRNITDKTKAIVAVDWGGKLCDYSALKSHRIPVIQDAAHRFSKIDHAVGGDYTCWSFQAIKFLSTGDGGAIAVPENQYTRAKLLRWYGLDRDSKSSFRCSQDIYEIGYKYHMNDISAAIGLANLDLAKDNEAFHRKNYASILGQPIAGSSWVAFIRTPGRDRFIKFMGSCGIEASLVHKRNDWHPAFRTASVNPDEQRPVLDKYCEEYVAIPCGWWLSNEDIKHIQESLAVWKELTK